MTLSKFANKYGLLLILASSLGIRMISSGQSLWLDEAISALAVKNNTFLELITKFSLGDTHPPLYYLILKAWTSIFGFTEVALRAPSVIFSVLTVYFTYKLGEFFGGKKMAILSSVLLAFAPLHVYYSQEARMYALTTLLVSMSFYFFLKEKWRYLSVTLLFLGLSDYLPLLILVPFWIYVFIKKNRESFFNLVNSHILLLIFLLFWLPVFIKQSSSSASYLASFPQWGEVLGGANIKELALIWIKFIAGRISFGNKFFYGLAILIPSFIVVIPLYKAFLNRGITLILWLWLVIPPNIFFIGSFFVPGFSYFRLLFILPSFYLLISWGVLKTNYRKILSLSLVLINIALSLTYLLDNSFWREDWKGLVSFVEEKVKGDEVLLVSYSEPFAGYIWYSRKPYLVRSFDQSDVKQKESLYTMDYLMDLTDPVRENYKKLENEGFANLEVYNFRNIGQLRYWKKI